MESNQQSELFQEVERLGRIGGWAYMPSSHSFEWTPQIHSIFEIPHSCPIDPEFVFSFFKGEAGKIVKTAFERCFQNNEPFRLKLPITTFSRKPKWVLIQGNPVIRQEKCLRTQGAIQDITEQMQLSRERDQYNHLAFELFSIFSADGKWLQASQNWKQSIGVDATELIGQDLWKYVQPEDMERFRNVIWGRWKENPVWNFESRLKTASGKSKWFAWNLSYDNVERIIYATCRNVDDLILQKHSLKENLDRSLDTIRTQDEFLSLVSHELRTPLVPILGYCQLLKYDVDDPEVIASLNEIEKAGRSLESLIQELLELSQVRHGKPIVKLSQFSLFDLLNHLISKYLKTFHQKALSINIDENDTLESLKQITLINDPRRIQKILERFLSNSLRFTEKGGVLLRVTPGEESGWYRVTVKDTGEGISAFFRDSIFQAFQQTESPDNKRHAGLGIGLSIVKQLATHINAKIGVDSYHGEGSEFWVEFENLPDSQIEK